MIFDVIWLNKRYDSVKKKKKEVHGIGLRLLIKKTILFGNRESGIGSRWIGQNCWIGHCPVAGQRVGRSPCTRRYTDLITDIV